MSFTKSNLSEIPNPKSAISSREWFFFSFYQGWEDGNIAVSGTSVLRMCVVLYVCVVVWDDGGVKWKELIRRCVPEPWLITGREVEAGLYRGRMSWKRRRRVLQYSADPCCKGARSSVVNYSQWQRERIRFTAAAGTAGEHTKGSEYEHRSFRKWTLTQ